MNTNVKPTARQAHWLSHLERARILKVPLTQYCRARGLNVQSLYNARHEQSGRARRVDGGRARQKRAAKAGRFVAVEFAATPTHVSGPACRIQLRDVVIECASLPEAMWVAALARGAGNVVP